MVLCTAACAGAPACTAEMAPAYMPAGLSLGGCGIWRPAVICSFHVMTLYTSDADAGEQAGVIGGGSWWRLLHRTQLPGAALLRRRECL